MFPWLSCLVDSLTDCSRLILTSMVTMVPSSLGVDADVVHHRLHQREALAPVRGGLRLGWQPAAAVGDGQLEAVGGDGGPQCDLVAGAVAVAVLDRVGYGFPGRDEGVLCQLRAEAAAVQPAAQPGADWSEAERCRRGTPVRGTWLSVPSSPRRPYPPGGASLAMSVVARSSRESSLPSATRRLRSYRRSGSSRAVRRARRCTGAVWTGAGAGSGPRRGQGPAWRRARRSGRLLGG